MPEFDTEATHGWPEVTSGVSMIESDLFSHSKIVKLEKNFLRHLGGSVVEHLPSAQVIVLGSSD